MNSRFGVALRSSAVWFVCACLCVSLPAAWSQDAPKLEEKQVKSLGKVDNGATNFVVVNSTGERLAWIFKKDKEQEFLVCDKKLGKQYVDIVERTIHFSPDGSRIACMAYIPPHSPIWVCDGVECPGSSILTLYTFSPDGKHTESESSANEHALRDGRPDGGVVIRATPIFSPNSQHCAYVGYSRDTKTSCIVSDGKNDQTFKTEKLGQPVWTPNSKSYAYTVSQGDKIGDKWVVFWGPTKLGPYDMVEGITFSPDSKRVAFRALMKDKWFVMVNDKKGPEFSNLGEIVFSSGGRMAYRASDKDGWSIFCDSKKGFACTDVGIPVFSPDGTLMAYRAAKDGETFVICNDKQCATYDEIGSVCFSPDGRHVAFAAGRKKDKFVVIDGVESPAHERLIVPDRPCEEKGKFRYVVIDKEEASLVEVEWPKDRTWEVGFVFDRK